MTWCETFVGSVKKGKASKAGSLVEISGFVTVHGYISYCLHKDKLSKPGITQIDPDMFVIVVSIRVIRGKVSSETHFFLWRLFACLAGNDKESMKVFAIALFQK